LQERVRGATSTAIQRELKMLICAEMAFQFGEYQPESPTSAVPNHHVRLRH
jgi:hypothetical protein